MGDIFVGDRASSLLFGKKVLMVGCSNMRALYKDFLWLLQSDSLIDNAVLKRRLESSCLGDTLVRRSELTKGRDFMEHRRFEKNSIELEYLFITRCYCDTIIEEIIKVKNGRKKAPDVIVIGSALWDLTRWGPDGPSDYRRNMVRLMDLFEECLPKETLVLWTTAPPTASKITGGLIIKQIEFMQEILRYEILSANLFASQLVGERGHDVVDFHYYLQSQIFRRSCDGVHYLPLPVRFMSNLILTHLSLSWDIPLPGVINNCLLGSLFKKVEEGLSACPVGENRENIAQIIELRAEPKRGKKRKAFAYPDRYLVQPPAKVQCNRNRNQRFRNHNRNFKPYNRY